MGAKPYTCEICSTSYKTSGNLAKHMRVKHPQEKPYLREKFEETFIDPAQLKQALEICSDKNKEVASVFLANMDSSSNTLSKCT